MTYLVLALPNLGGGGTDKDWVLYSGFDSNFSSKLKSYSNFKTKFETFRNYGLFF